jgi:hypothetical protein
MDTILCKKSVRVGELHRPCARRLPGLSRG